MYDFFNGPPNPSPILRIGRGDLGGLFIKLKLVDTVSKYTRHIAILYRLYGSILLIAT